jgi:hypothetical protein
MIGTDPQMMPVAHSPRAQRRVGTMSSTVVCQHIIGRYFSSWDINILQVISIESKRMGRTASLCTLAAAALRHHVSNP